MRPRSHKHVRICITENLKLFQSPIPRAIYPQFVRVCTLKCSSTRLTRIHTIETDADAILMRVFFRGRVRLCVCACVRMCELCSVNRGAHARRAKGEVCVHCGGHGIVRSAERILTSILGRGSLTPLLSRVSLPIILSCHRRCYPLGRHPSLCPIAPSPPTTLPPKTSPCRASGFDDRDGACEHTHTHKITFSTQPPPERHNAATSLQMEGMEM